jgi:AraC-like DNA-binding protein
MAIFYNHFAPLYLLPGPLLYLYTKTTLRDNKTFDNWKDYLHFIPALINLVAIAPYLVVPFEEKVIIAEQIINNLELIKTIKVNWLYPPLVGFLARPFLLLIYGVAIFIEWKKFNPKEETNKHIQNNQDRIVKKWILALNTFTCIAAAGFLVVTLNLTTQEINRVLINAMPIHFGVGIIFGMLPIILFLFPKILYGIPISTKKEKPLTALANQKKKKIIKPEEDPFLSLSEEILAYLEKEKPFVNSGFSMSHIAVIFNVPQHHVAYCFNHVLNKKFSTLRTEFKVNHAIELLDQGLTQSLSVDGIGIKAGFATRSNFYSSFKAITGLTPSEYLESKK